VEAPALVFNSQEDFMAAYKAGKLDRDFVAVIRFQGPRANGMPELHALTPALANLQDAGRQVALVTDGRMSGARARCRRRSTYRPKFWLAARWAGARWRHHPPVRQTGTLEALVDSAVWHARAMATADMSPNQVGMGRELFAMFRNSVCEAEKGATTFPLPSPIPTTVGLHKDPVGNTVPGSDEDFSMKKEA
jgi:phosphogluconate dehydratase